MRGRCLTFLMTASTMVAAAADLQGFSFDYVITGDRSIAPFQVFDDGAAMFLQFRDASKLPSIFVRDASGSRVVTPEAQGGYVRIAGIAQRLELVSDRKTAAVISTRKPALGSSESARPIATGAADPVPPASLAQGRSDRVANEPGALPASAQPSPSPMPSSTAKAMPPPAAAIGGDTAAGTPVTFEVQAGQRLSEALRRFLASHRLELDWDTGGADYEIRYGFRVTGGSVDEVLFGVLSPFKLNAVTRRGNSVVAVSRAT
jgi:hypothetical protein